MDGETRESGSFKMLQPSPDPAAAACRHSAAVPSSRAALPDSFLFAPQRAHFSALLRRC